MINDCPHLYTWWQGPQIGSMATYESMVFGEGNVTFYQVRPLSGGLSSDINLCHIAPLHRRYCHSQLTTRLPSKASRWFTIIIIAIIIVIINHFPIREPRVLRVHSTGPSDKIKRCPSQEKVIFVTLHFLGNSITVCSILLFQMHCCHIFSFCVLIFSF